MKKILNSKGMTLVEIILSIGLVSIVMVQILTLLVDLKDEQVLGQDKTGDLTNRALIIKTVEDDFMSRAISSMSLCNFDPATDELADYTIKSCLKLIYSDDTSHPRFLIAARDRFDKNDYFIYGYGESADSRLPVSNGYEAWKLASGLYPLKTEGSCGFILKYYSLKSPDEMGDDDYSQSNYFQIVYPVEIKESISNTSMTFDLEFLYYFRPSMTNPPKVNIDEDLKTCTNVKYKSS